MTQAEALDRLYGDTFVVPVGPGMRNASPTERAVLFSIQDTPVMVALNKYREVAYVEGDGHQTVTGVLGRRNEYG